MLEPDPDALPGPALRPGRRVVSIMERCRRRVLPNPRAMPSEPYPIPAARHRVEQVVRRSRFITTVAHAATADEARSVIDEVRAEFGDATHNCWAFAAGPPGSMAVIGMSDDGEPHGTAGRPMLEALLHSGVGEVVAVVTRYFEALRLVRKVVRTPLRVTLDYAALEPFRRLATDHDARIDREEFAAAVTIHLAVPESDLQTFRTAVAGLTAGQAQVELAGEPDQEDGDGPEGDNDPDPQRRR
jgi:putative IMPACT (imprinted ancient) family translation regulator